jgi:hypothetical protein
MDTDAVNRWSGHFSPLAAEAVRQLWSAGARDQASWSQAVVLEAAATVCRDASIVGAPMTPIRVAAAVNVYSVCFLPWGSHLETGIAEWDTRALGWRLNREHVVDFLWAEDWSQALPSSREFAKVGRTVRVCDLTRPQSSREYRDGAHSPLAPRQAS